jgi:predicted phosphate transport protein (TIGR00153 family)
MRLRLRPRDNFYFDALSRAAQNAAEAARVLCRLIAADPEDRAKLSSEIHDLEHVGDGITHDIYQHLNATFVTPLDREDLGRLTGAIDDCLDLIDEAADLTVLYSVGELPDQTTELVGILERQATLTADAMCRLRELQGLRDYWVEVNRLENDADRAYRRTIAHIFDGGYDPLTVLKLKDVIDRLEEAIDGFERVANTVEQITIKES